MPSTRRSGRLAGPRKVYTEDPFESAGPNDDSDPERASRSSKGKRKGRTRDDSPSDQEFVAASDEEMDEKIDDDDDASEDGEEMEIDESGDGSRRTTAISHPRYLKKRRPDGTVAPSADETHFRGILDPKEHVAKAMHYTLTFGSDERDLLAAVYSRDQWFRGVDSCFPTRFALEGAKNIPDYEYGATFGIHPDDVKKESTHGWDWYYDRDVGERFRKRQRIETIKESEARRTYLPRPKKGKHTILLGPADNQQPISLGYHESFNFGEAWGETKAKTSDRAAETEKTREGWIINFGQKIHCMGWAPNQDGLSQYLAVAAPITEEQKEDYNPPGSQPFSAFKPSQPYPSALQLWEFKGRNVGILSRALDMDSKPRLRLALGSDWGDLRRISWCPVAREKRDEDEEDTSKTIGLLAGIWGDGKVRVLDTKVRRGSGATEFGKICSPVFEAKPPSTVCTCVAWLSPSDIAVGCANGFVAIWSIVPSSAPEHLPYFYRPIHGSFVLNISSAYPTHPQLLITIAMDGETRLWSITNPQQESVSTVRMRTASPHISYSPVLQSVCSTDENDFARMLPIRRFFASNSIAKVPSTVSAMSPCSFWHPCVMYGGAGGEVLGTNPLRRLFYSKEQQWRQMWFTHDWVPGREPDSAGVSRFYDGYRAEKQSLARNMTGENRSLNGIALATIYDEGTHITALGWNPNRLCAAWASAAMGCGLVRVEDLAT